MSYYKTILRNSRKVETLPMLKQLIFYISIFQGISSLGQSFSDFTQEEIKEDIEFVFNSIQNVHPDSNILSLETKEHIISSLNSQFYSESDAFFILNGFLKKLNDGHSNIKFSSVRARQLIRHGVFFPYELEFFDSTAVVVGHINGLETDAIGNEIFKINQIPIKEILTDLSVVAMKDGENNDSMEDWIADDFWFYFTLYNGFRNSYSISYLKDGSEIHEIAKARTRISHIRNGILSDFRNTPLEFYYENEVPILKIHSFEKRDKIWWRRELNSIMSRLNENQDSNLVIDFRGNGGGQEELQNILLETFGIDATEKYLSEQYKTVEWSTLSGVNNKFIEKLKAFGLKRFIYTKKDSENYRSKKLQTTKKKNESKFSGGLFILVDGATFSCGSDAAAILREHYDNALVLGTETRGSGKENYAGYFLHITLPNTGFELRIPRVKYVINTNKYHKDSGVIPDILVQADKKDLVNGKDTQLNAALNLMAARSTSQALIGIKP